MTPYEKLRPFDKESGDLNVVIETPKGSRNKFDYDPKKGLFKLGGVLPAGAVFPFDFGFIPRTLGEDGDPVDILVLMDEPAFTGCLVVARLVGGIVADQTEKDGETVRNDRLIAVAAEAELYKDVKSLSSLSDALLHEIEHFFVAYNQGIGKQFDPKERVGPKKAEALVEEGIKKARRG
jgi:inorganic pyrophosphatase